MRRDRRDGRGPLRPIRVGNLRQMAKYSLSVRRAFEARGSVCPGCEIPVPGLADGEPPGGARDGGGQLVGVLTVESDELAFDDADEAALSVVASVVASGIEAERAGAPRRGRPGSPESAAVPTTPSLAVTHVRFFAVDGSTFLDGDYLIKGVAGRILWSLLGQHEPRVGSSSPTARSASIPPSSCRSSTTTSRAGSSC